jgi:aryl-alcohol dehydrogenase-like predicted oxidoreductase
MLKLALGTVQFGLAYGINNQSGVPKDAELKSIFCLAKQSGIDVLDTAQAYGNSEERIGDLTNDEFKVISKFKKISPPFPFDTELRESLKKLRTDSLYGYMAHDVDLLLENPSWWEGLKLTKEEGLVKKIGYSLYSVNQLEPLLAKQMIPDIIQFPYNIFDRQFESHFIELRGMGVEIHTRSVFLQGLYFMSPEGLPSKIKSLQSAMHELSNISLEFEIPIGTIALNYVIQNPLIDKVVIGVDSEIQLKQNIEMLKQSELPSCLVNKINNICIDDKSLLNPVNW